MPVRGYEFYLECSTRHITSEGSEQVRYRVEHEKMKLISTNGHVIFCSLYKHTNNNFFDNFPKMSDHFPKVSEDFLKIFKRLDGRYSNGNLKTVVLFSLFSCVKISCLCAKAHVVFDWCLYILQLA